MSKILANEIANYGDNAPIEVKEGINIPAGKPLQADGVSGASGQVLSSTGLTVEWTTPFDGDYNSLTNLPSIPAAQVRADWNAVGTISEILNKPVVPAQPSITTAAASSGGALAYNPANGEFTFTPPDLSGFVSAANIANSANWDTAYGWGDHAAEGYLTAETDPQFQTWFNNNGASGITTTAINQWNTAYGWGDHATEGYLTFEQDTLDSVSGRNGITTNTIQVGQIDIGSGSQSILPTGANDVTLQNTDAGGQVILRAAGNVEIQSYQGSRLLATETSAATTGGLSLYYATGLTTEVVRLTTTSTGVSINGNLSVSGTTDLDIEDLNNVDIGGGLSDQQVLKWDASTSSWKPANDLVGGQSGIELADLSVSQNAPGSASLLYNNTNGVFTYTPPDLTNFIGDTDFGAAGLMTTDGSGNYSITVNASANWNTAYGWGDHSTQGYLTAETDPVFSAHVASGILQTNINHWNTAYAWGNHGAQGYLTSESDTLATVTGRGSTSPEVLQVGGLSIGDDGGTKAKSLKLGDDADLTLYYDGRVGYVTSYIESDQMIIRPKTTPSDTYIDMLEGGPVRLYHGSTTRLSTSSSGVGVNGDLDVGGKIFYSNNFADLTALNAVNAGTYHGMFAHVHAEAHGYFAHAGGWVQLLDTGSDLNQLSGVNLSVAPTTGQVLKYNGSEWVADDDDSGNVVANVTISDTAPGSSTNGDLWWESDTGRLKIRYQDVDSAQWVDATPPLTNPNVPLYVGELEIWNNGNEIRWLGTNGCTPSVQSAEGGGGFLTKFYRLTFPVAFSSADDWVAQVTCYEPTAEGDVVLPSIRKSHPGRIDMSFYDSTNSNMETNIKAAICIYAI